MTLPSAPGSYLDVPTASPMAIAELMPGARNLMDYAAVGPGDELLILAESHVDPLALQAIAAAAAVRDARPHLLVVPPFSPGGRDRRGASRATVAAVAAADVVIGCTWSAQVHGPQLFFTEMPSLGVRSRPCT